MKIFVAFINQLKSFYNTSPLTKDLFSGVFLSLILFSLIIFIAKPLSLNLYQLALALSEVNKVQENLSTRLESLNLAGLSIQSLEEKDIELISKAMPTTVSAAGYLENLENLGLSSGVNISSIAAKNLALDSTPPTYKSLKEVSFTVDLNGNLENIKRFTLGLKKMVRSTSLENITLSSNNQSGPLKAKLDLRTYYLR